MANPTILQRVATAEPIDVWPDPLPLRDELPEVLPFNPAMLPGELRAWVEDISERMNCPMDLVAIPAMVAAGSLVGRRVGIRPQRLTNWQEAGNLWGCVVARPGSLKSPAASEALGPLRRLEACAVEEHQAALVQFKAAEALFKLEREETEKGARAALKDKAKADPRGHAMSMLAALAEPQPPVERRYLTSDVTAEKLGEICAANPQGVMIYRDEMLSLFSELDQAEKAAARGLFMAGWGGQDGYTFDRIMRGTVRVPAVNLSIFGTTQPGRLAGYVRGSLKRFDDGMVQRLQLLSWPDFDRSFQEADRHPNSEARQRAHECYTDIAALDARELCADFDECDGPNAVPFLRFDVEAQDWFSDWRVGLERKVRSDDLSAPFMAHLSKYRGLIPRLALICHIASNGIGPVTMAAAEQAGLWSEYLESHARRAYAATSLDNAEAARAIWRRIRKDDLSSTFTAREIQRKGWSGLNDKDRITAGLAALVDADWLSAAIVETGGRRSTLYKANPKAIKA